MKRILACFLMILYATCSMGMRVHVHYCMDKFSGIEFFGNRQKCPRCGMDIRQERKDCCRDVIKFVKHDKLHMAGPGVIIMDALVLPPMHFLYSISPVYRLARSEEIPLNSSAPPGEPVYLLCRNLRL